MHFHFARQLLSAALCCALAACDWLKPAPVPKAMPLRFPKENPTDAAKAKRRQVGTVLLVNAESGFVLVETHGAARLESGQALKCLRDGADSGVLTVSGERQGTHVVADIVTGTPRKGDQVFQ